MTDEHDGTENDDIQEPRPAKKRGRVYEDEDSDSAFSMQWYPPRVRLNDKTAQSLLKWTGPSLKWTVIFLSIGGFVIMVCYGISMVVKP